MLKRAPKKKHRGSRNHSDAKKVRVVTQTLATGNMRLVSELEGVSYSTIREWKCTPWWAELAAEIKAAHKAGVDSKLNRIINKALDTMEDRLDNGDVVWNQKTGEISRKPVSIKEARGAANDLLQRQAVLEKLENDENTTKVQQTVADQLELLKAEFAKFQTGRTIEPIEFTDVTPRENNALHEEREEGLQNRVPEIREQARADQSAGRAQHSASGNGESRESLQGGREGRGPQEASEQGWDELDDEFADSDAEAESLLQQNPEWEFEESKE